MCPPRRLTVPTPPAAPHPTAQEMRRSAHYAQLLAKYSDLRASKMPMKPGGIGWLGDQTLYSWMTVNGTGGRQVFHVIPCGWNRQIGTHMVRPSRMARLSPRLPLASPVHPRDHASLAGGLERLLDCKPM